MKKLVSVLALVVSFGSVADDFTYVKETNFPWNSLYFNLRTHNCYLYNKHNNSVTHVKCMDFMKRGEIIEYVGKGNEYKKIIGKEGM